MMHAKPQTPTHKHRDMEVPKGGEPIEIFTPYNQHYSQPYASSCRPGFPLL